METIVITGCSSGIGKEAVKYFANNGWKVAATMRNPEKETELNNLKNVSLYQLDVTDKRQVESTLEQIKNDFEQIDCVVNNAGFGAMGPLEYAAEQTVRRQIDVNLFGVIWVCQNVIPIFRAQGFGKIINISSALGFTTMPLASLYEASKFAVEGLTEGLFYELAPLGIQVKIIEPGGFKTNFFNAADFSHSPVDNPYKDIQAGMDKMFEDNMDSFGEPIDVAKTIYLAATDNKQQLRYVVGRDAELMLENRKTHTVDQLLAHTLKGYLPDIKLAA